MTQTTSAPIDISIIKTKTGKTLSDFTVPLWLTQHDPQLVSLILRSESMKDEERQYWFNLADVMKPAQVEKLRAILLRERKKLDDIEQKYSSVKKPALSIEEQQAQIAQMHQQRSAQRSNIEQAEAQSEQAESEHEDAILAELENL